MKDQLLNAIIQQIAIPELLQFIRGWHAGSGGKLPTDAEVIGNFQLHADRVVAAGEAFLASKGEPK